MLTHWLANSLAYLQRVGGEARGDEHREGHDGLHEHHLVRGRLRVRFRVRVRVRVRGRVRVKARVRVRVGVRVSGER